MQQKKVLIITYYWPPSGGSGVQRWMYFAKYLNEFGVLPTVITVDEKYASYPSKDFSFNDQVVDIRVYKTKTLEPLRFYSFLKSGKTEKVVPQGNVGGEKKGLLDKAATYIRANFFIPDARVGWNRYAYKQAKELIAKEHFDLIITTGPPHSTHLVGLKLKQELNIKWMADFRDPWTEVYYNNIFKRTKKNEEKDKSLEYMVIKNADHILTIGPSMKELIESKISNKKNKVSYIYNGFDEKLFESINKIKYPEFTIAHIGLWSKNQAHKEIISALSNILNENQSLIIRFVLVGTIDNEIIELLSHIPRLIIDYKGKVTHKKAIQEMMNADLLLNCLAIIEHSKIIISGKLMEYLATSNPIIIIGNKNGDAAHLIKEINNAYVVEPNNMEELTKLILSIKNDSPNKTDFNPTIYSRKNTSNELSKLIFSICKS